MTENRRISLDFESETPDGESELITIIDCDVEYCIDHRYGEDAEYRGGHTAVWVDDIHISEFYRNGKLSDVSTITESEWSTIDQRVIEKLMI